MMLFQNMLQLELVGTSGNADPHYAKDWSDIIIDTSLDRFEDSTDGQSDSFEGKDYCTFPSVRVMEVFYERINTKEDPQYLIKRMQQYSTNDL